MYIIKKTLLLSVVLNFVLSAHAQEKALLIVSYEAKYRVTEGSQLRTDNMCLSIGKSFSHFYSVDAIENERKIEAVRKKGGFIQDNASLTNIFGKSGSAQTYQVFKNIPSGKITQIDQFGKDHLRCITMKHPISWELGKRDSVIAGYKCKYASAKFHGRTWNVWYAPGISSSEGPWKLYGLPGLILKADDSTGSFSFVVRKIAKAVNETVQLGEKKYKDCSYNKLMQMYKIKAENPIAFLRSILPPGYEDMANQISSKIKPGKRKACLIELSE